MSLDIVFLIAISTLSTGLAYRNLWRHFNEHAVPKGFGVFLPIILLISLFKGNYSDHLVIIFSLISFFSFIYWLDDLYGLNPILRIILSFATGVLLYLISLIYNGSLFNLGILVPAVLYGLFNVGLTNIANFYDGADLNISILILLSCFSFLLIPISTDWLYIIIACIVFIAAFSILNRKPNFLYLGDAGAFAYSSLITSLLLYKTRSNLYIPLDFLIPFLLPVLDIFYVICLRIKREENLLTRNYLHLYQKLNIRFNNKIYLLPQIINFIVCFLMLNLFKRLQINNLAIIIFLFAITGIIYMLFLKILSRRSQN
jgi:UDP-N-acetylmuramyl pentapeptide phosphotransferase/UDP-N-acetylglucosamine-1-phosphate transferase